MIPVVLKMFGNAVINVIVSVSFLSCLGNIQASGSHVTNVKNVGDIMDIAAALEITRRKFDGVHVISSRPIKPGTIKKFMTKNELSTKFSTDLQFHCHYHKHDMVSNYLDLNYLNVSEAVKYFNKLPNHAKTNSWFFFGSDENLIKLALEIKVSLDQMVFFVSSHSGRVSEHYLIQGKLVTNRIGKISKANDEKDLVFKEDSNLLPFLQRRSNLQGISLQGYISPDAPFMHYQYSTLIKVNDQTEGWFEMPNGSGEHMSVPEDTVTGLNMDVLRRLEFSMNFTSKLLHPRSYNASTYGNKMKDGSWDGYIGNLMRGDGDFIAGPVTLHPFRHEAVDYILPIGQESLSLYIPIQGFDMREWNSFLYPLRPNTWVFLLLNSIVLMLFLKPLKVFYFDEVSVSFPTEFVNMFGDFWMFLMSNIGRAPITEYPNNVCAVRVLFFMVFLASNIVSMSYRASLTAALSVQTVSMPFQSIEELISSPFKLIYGKRLDKYILTFHSSPTATYVSEWVKLVNEIIVKEHDKDAEMEVQDGIDRLLTTEEPTTILLLRESLAFWLKDRCLVTEAYASKFPNLNSFAFAKRSPYTSFVNYQLLKLWEQGAINTFRKAHLTINNYCDHNNGISKKKVLSARKLASLFAVISSGMVLSVIILFMEKIYKRRYCNWTVSRPSLTKSDMRQNNLKMKSQQERYLDKKKALCILIKEISTRDIQTIMRRLDDIPVLEYEFTDHHE